MNTNVGTYDRIIRIVTGLLLLGVALGAFGPAYTSVWGWIGVIPLVTGFVGWCPAYTLFGVDTCGRRTT